MKTLSASLLFFLLAIGCVSIFSACSRSDRFAGEWIGTPTRMLGVQGASDATSTISIDFAPSTDVRRGGAVIMTATIDVSQQVVGTEFTLDAPYQANVAATASIRGHYVVEDDDDDDVLINFEPGTLQVNVDPAGVTFSENILTGLQRPMLDSLTRATAGNWQAAIVPAIRDEFYKYQKIEDIKVHHDNMMSCEVADRDYTFRRVAPN